MPAVDLKKLSTYMTSLANEKAKMEKAATSKKKGGKFKGAKLKVDDKVSTLPSYTIPKCVILTSILILYLFVSVSGPYK